MGLTPVGRAAGESWTELDVFKAGSKVVTDGDGGGLTAFELNGSVLPVLEDDGHRLRVRDYSGRWHANRIYEKAHQDYDRAIELDPTYAMAMSRKAYLLATCADERLRDVPRAHELLEVIVRVRPVSPYNDETIAEIEAENG